jgi:quercetin dioxygenase-like cupin family protein
MFPYVALSKDKAWQPGPYEGVELMILHQHESTGGLLVLRKFRAGHTIPAHTHPGANEWAYVLSGEWEESASHTQQARCFSRLKAFVTVRTSRTRKSSA